MSLSASSTGASAEAVEPPETEPPRAAAGTVAVDRDVCAEVAAAETLAVEERHIFCFPFLFDFLALLGFLLLVIAFPHKVVRLPFFCTGRYLEASCFSQYRACLAASLSCFLRCARTQSGSRDTGRRRDSSLALLSESANVLPAEESLRVGLSSETLGGLTLTMRGWPFLGLRRVAVAR